MRRRGLLPRLAVVLAVTLVAAPGAPADPTPAELAEAREWFAKARRLEDTGQWSEALELLQRVAAVKTTPQVRFHIALCMENVGLLTQALEGFQRAAREASRSGVPLYLVGVGDARETPDLGLADLQVEDVITRGDRLFFQARLTSRGAVAAKPVPVVLYEKQGDKLIERGRTTATPDPTSATSSPVSSMVSGRSISERPAWRLLRPVA